MSYLSGIEYDFLLRFHEFPTISGDLTGFAQEYPKYVSSGFGSGYFNFDIFNRVEKEIIKKEQIFGITGLFSGVP